MYIIKVLKGPDINSRFYWRGKERTLPYNILCEGIMEKNYVEEELKALGYVYEVQEVLKTEYVEVKGNEVKIIEKLQLDDNGRRRKKEEVEKPTNE